MDDIEDCDRTSCDSCPRRQLCAHRTSGSLPPPPSNMTAKYDCIIIGAGTIGCSVARELAKYRLRILVLDEGDDVSEGASKANSGIIHGGYDAKYGTLKAKLSLRGNRMFRGLDTQLNFGYNEIGSLVLARKDELPRLEELMANGKKCGCEELLILNKAQVQSVEPNVHPEVEWALYCPHSGTISPYEYTVALAENAVSNGVKMKLQHRVTDIKRHDNAIDYRFRVLTQTTSRANSIYRRQRFEASSQPLKSATWTTSATATTAGTASTNTTPTTTSSTATTPTTAATSTPSTSTTSTATTTPGPLPRGEEYLARFVINCAGVASDKVAEMVGARDFSIIPTVGEFILLDTSQGALAKHVLFPLPDPIKGKGVLCSPTFHGNLLLGPTSRPATDVGLTREEVAADIVQKAARSLPVFDVSKAITSFWGVRAKTDRGDFIVEESKKVPGFINCAGIDSPGLTSSPAVAEYVVEILRAAGCPLIPDPNFTPFRRPILIRPKPKWFDEEAEIDHPDPARNIVCRCERISEAEIVDAIHRDMPVLSTDAVKKRTRAGMGRCQGNFCRPRVAKIVSRETGLPLTQVLSVDKSEFLPIHSFKSKL